MNLTSFADATKLRNQWSELYMYSTDLRLTIITVFKFRSERRENGLWIWGVLEIISLQLYMFLGTFSWLILARKTKCVNSMMHGQRNLYVMLQLTPKNLWGNAVISMQAFQCSAKGSFCFKCLVRCVVEHSGMDQLR